MILVEGYKHDDIPKIVVNSDGIRELSPRRPGVIAVISIWVIVALAARKAVQGEPDLKAEGEAQASPNETVAKS